MKYERLTTKGKDGKWTVLVNDNDRLIEDIQNIVDRLAELEDKIENGMLIELPFITQDARGVWRVHFYSKRFNTIDCYVCYDREEAEKRLKELQNG